MLKVNLLSIFLVIFCLQGSFARASIVSSEVDDYIDHVDKNIILKSIPSSRVISEGLSYRNAIFDNTFEIHILEVDPEKFKIVPSRSKGKLEHVLPMAMRQKAIAAVNGGFFIYQGDFISLPIGLLKIDDKWHMTPENSCGAIGWSHDGKNVLFDEVKTKITGRTKDKIFPIDGINLPPNYQKIMLYNCFFNETTKTSSNDTSLELILASDRIAKIKSHNTTIPSNFYVLSVGLTKKKEFSKVKVGDPIEWDIEVISQSNPPYTSPEEWNQVNHITSAAPILVRNGKNVVSTTTTNHFFSTDFKARTAVGILPNGNWMFVVVDGKLFPPKTGERQGITLDEIAQIMLDLGCIEALNLDSGGSAIMVVEDKIVSNPCGERHYPNVKKKLRPVSDAILIIPK
jgi:exopolysaccharide biosynthesis protein